MGRDNMPVSGLITISTSIPSAPDFGRNETLETELFALPEITIQTMAYGVGGFCRYLMLLGRDDGHDFGAGETSRIHDIDLGIRRARVLPS